MRAMTRTKSRFRAVLFDFGGVLSTSPFEAFARYEREHELPENFLRHVNATNAETNAWACLEQAKITVDEFADRYRDESRALGFEVDGHDVLALLSGDLRPEMLDAVRRCREEHRTGLLTNNFLGLTDAGHEGEPEPAIAAVLAAFDTVIESSQVGVRKPDPRFYEIACEALDIDPTEAVFLDDLGVNLKPARAMGMTTIKVTSPSQALADLGACLGLEFANSGLERPNLS